MEIKQWKDESLAQYSYAILSEGEKKVVLIDPARNPALCKGFLLHVFDGLKIKN